MKWFLLIAAVVLAIVAIPYGVVGHVIFIFTAAQRFQSLWLSEKGKAIVDATVIEPAHDKGEPPVV